VRAQALSKHFGDFVAVDRVTFEVSRREIFGFLGPNGAGKTTTIKMLTGLLRPTDGQASVAGHDIDTEREAIRRTIGYMSQLFSLYPDLTVEDWVLEMAGLLDHRSRLTGQLPLGWKQRLALGCAVLHEPSILFLDEPTSGVDPNSRRAFWELIYSLTDVGTTVFVTTHYMEEAEYCHRLALMNRGALIALDTPAGLRSGMEVPILEVRTSDTVRALEVVARTAGVTDAAMFGRALHVTVRDVAEAHSAIETGLRAAGIELRGLERIVPSLEDVFVARVRAAGGAPTD
jgi:ABC-2 type transport system ATP-binding protein